jgi:hypothetical protein
VIAPLGTIYQKLIDNYTSEKIVEAMIEDSISQALSDSCEHKEFGYAITTLLDKL